MPIIRRFKQCKLPVTLVGEDDIVCSCGRGLHIPSECPKLAYEEIEVSQEEYDGLMKYVHTEYDRKD